MRIHRAAGLAFRRAILITALLPMLDTAASATVTCQVKTLGDRPLILRAMPSLRSAVVARLATKDGCFLNQPSIPGVRRGGWGRFSVTGGCQPMGAIGWIRLSQLENCD